MILDNSVIKVYNVSMNTKVCTKCGEEKTLEDYPFVRSKGRNSYYSGRCKECKKTYRSAYNSMYYHENQEKENLRRKAWGAVPKNRESLNAQGRNRKKTLAYREMQRKANKKYRSSHLARVREMERAYRNSEKGKQSHALWRKGNPEKIKAWSRQAHSRRREFMDQGDATQKLLMELLKKALEYGKCPLCNKETQAFHLEHATPLSRGGTHSKDNVYYCCASCNFKKSTKTLEEFANISFADLPITL